jgi:hypothetical protein
MIEKIIIESQKKIIELHEFLDLFKETKDFRTKSCTRNSTIEQRIIKLFDFLNTRDFITKSISVNFICKRAIILRDEAG